MLIRSIARVPSSSTRRSFTRSGDHHHEMRSRGEDVSANPAEAIVDPAAIMTESLCEASRVTRVSTLVRVAVAPLLE
jgi:hypothetical protein